MEGFWLLHWVEIFNFSISKHPWVLADDLPWSREVAG